MEIKKINSNEDLDIIHSILGGNTEDFALLIQKYNQRLYRVIRSYLYNEEDVEDVMQDTYLQCYAKLSSFRFESSFSTWLVRIGINFALAHINSLKRASEHTEKSIDVSLSQHPSTALSPEHVIISLENKLAIEKIIDSIDTIYKEAFVLYHIEKMPTDEIADCLQISPVNVRVRVKRAKDMIKNKFSDTTENMEMLYTIGGTRCSRIASRTMDRILHPSF